MPHACRKITPAFYQWPTLACSGWHALSPFISWAHPWSHACCEHSGLWDSRLNCPTLDTDGMIKHRGQVSCSAATFSRSFNCLLTLGSGLSFHRTTKARRFWRETGTTLKTLSHSFTTVLSESPDRQNAHAPAYVQQRAHCNSPALINPYKFTLAKEYISLLLCWSPFKESWDAPHRATLPESSLETAVPPWLIPLVPLGSGTLSCVNVLFQSANRSC